MKLSFKDFTDKRERVAVVGLGYVGLPLAHLMSKHFDVIGFDINEKRVRELNENFRRKNSS